MKFNHSFLTILLILLLGTQMSYAQSSLAAKLGYDEDARLLIIHSDDIGVSHSENKATFEAIEKGSVNSGSIMMPCPWVPEVADYVKENPKVDFGLHLTLTSEWKHMKWGSVAPASQVSSLLNEEGYFYSDCLTFGQNAKVEEAIIELRAQIDKAILMGINPTHLDSHMGCLLFSSPELFGAYLALGREYKIPSMISRFFLKAAPDSFHKLITPQDVILENVITASPDDYKNGMDKYYEKVLTQLEPGVNVLLIHTAYDNEEMKALTIDHPMWGADWRQKDFDFFTSNKCKRILKDQNIKLITWRYIQSVIYGNP